MSKRISLLAASILTTMQTQAVTANYGWEDNADVLGQFNASHLQHINSADQARSGNYSLQIEDNDPIDNATPQSFVAWINELTDGDTVTVSFWVYDETEDRPAGRIWGHYTNDNTDINSYAGSAGGNSSYTDGSGWQQVSHTWTFDSSSNSRDGLVIEFRHYDSADFTTGNLYLDDIEITSSAGIITLANGQTVDTDDGNGGNDTSNLIISEYVEGSSNNKALELYNSGDQVIDLAAENYSLARYSNGGSNPSNIALSGTVAAGGVFVVAHTSASDAIKAVADQLTGSINHNGDDAYVLMKAGQVVDSFGQVGTDPGSAWGSEPTSTANNTLRRLTSVTIGDIVIDDAFDPAQQWSGHGTDEISDLGSYHGDSSGGGNNGNLTCDSSYTQIYAIQGSGATSPMLDNEVEVEAIVTADFQTGIKGFYLQSADNEVDNDAQTSEGIFVYTNNTPIQVAMGDRIRVKAKVTESFGVTQLSDITASKICSSTNALPQTTELTLPFSSPESAEVLEGMLVSFNGLTVNDNYDLARFGSLTLANGRRMIPTQVAAPGAPANAIEAQNALNALILDDASNSQNPATVPYPAPGLTASNTVRTGDSASMSQGVLHYAFGAYRVYPISDVEFQASNPRTPTPELAVRGNLQIASFNVLNFFNTLNERGADTAEELQRQTAKIVAAINALDADIVGLMEIENDGYQTGSSISDLVNALNTAAPGYDWQYVTPQTDKIGTDAISVGMLYRSVNVSPQGNTEILDSSNSIVDEHGQPLFIDSKNRPSMAQKFALNSNGEEVVVIVNHLKSKASNCDAIGDPDLGDGQGNCNLTRTKAAQALGSWLNTEFDEDAVVVLGDLNAYAKEDPLTALATAGLSEVFQALNKQNAYSYVFRGQAGQLDHALGNAKLMSKLVDATEWHINTDEPRALDYNTEFKSAEQIQTLYAADPYRASDHDPALIALNLEPLVNPDITPIDIAPVAKLADKAISNLSKTQSTWQGAVNKRLTKITKLEAKIAELDPETQADKIQKLQTDISNKRAKNAIYLQLVTTLDISLGNQSAQTVQIERQTMLNDKNQEKLLRKQTRFEARANSQKAAQLEAKAAELMAQGKTEKAQKKLNQAEAARAKAQVFSGLSLVLKACI